MINFSWVRVGTMIRRYWYEARRDISKLFDLTYWPLIDIVLMGFMGTWLRADAVLPLMAGLVLWQVAYRTNLEISRNMLIEIWNNNLMNIFTTPLTAIEWLVSLMITGIAGATFTIFFGSSMVALLYQKNILSIGLSLIPCIGLLIVSGWILGLLASCFLVRWGQRVDTMVWVMGWIPTPFCSVYYPTEILPLWAQKVGAVLPMTPIFGAIRAAITTGTLPWNLVAQGALLTALYFSLALALFLYMFKKTKISGIHAIQ